MDSVINPKENLQGATSEWIPSKENSVSLESFTLHKSHFLRALADGLAGPVDGSDWWRW